MSRIHAPLQFDLAIAGGGLAGGLIALALAELRPELSVALVDSDAHFGGNHIWSFFDNDIAPEHRWLIAPLICHGWRGYDVRFPAHERRFDNVYYAIESERLDAVIRQKLSPAQLFSHAKALAVGPKAIVLSDGRRINAGAVIDCRGPAGSKTMRGGWQKFAGQLLDCDEPHGITRPLIMDAAVEQIDGFRFVYLLPFSPTQLFVEDTYYSNDRTFNASALRQRIAHYADDAGLGSYRILREETGILPVPTGGDFSHYWRAGGKKLAKAGARAGLFHPVTSYSLPDAVRTAIFVAQMESLDVVSLHDQLHERATRHWRQGWFYRMLNKMLFHASEPEQRYRILQRFYRLPAPLIARYYAGRTNWRDRLRILVGKPPVAIGRAIQAILRN
jgi:lycopene beta-cyclase